ncbi:MAG: nitroreductase family protein [Desulforhopalus sp.]
MEFIDVVRTRRSIRKYTDEPVPEEMIESVLRAAMAAPSAGNQQPWQFIVVKERDSLDAIPSFHPYSKMVQNAAVAILICGDPDGKKWPAYWPQDCSAATQNLLLAARDLGVGTVWAGVYPDEGRMAGFRKLLGIPENIYPFSLIPVGWPATTFRDEDRFNPNLIHLETW